MLIADSLDAQGRGDRLSLVTIDATDIDQECVKQAQAARYSRDALVEVPPGLAQRYFERAAELIRIAHPDVRDALAAEARALHLD